MRADGEVHKTSPESDGVAETNPRLQGILWNLWRWAASLALLPWKPYWLWHPTIQTELDKGEFWQVLTFTHHISAVSSDGWSLWHCAQNSHCALPEYFFHSTRCSDNPTFLLGDIFLEWFLQADLCRGQLSFLPIVDVYILWEQQTNKRGNCAV